MKRIRERWLKPECWFSRKEVYLEGSSGRGLGASAGPSGGARETGRLWPWASVALVLDGSSGGTAFVHVAGQASRVLLLRWYFPRVIGVVFALHSDGLEKGGSSHSGSSYPDRSITRETEAQQRQVGKEFRGAQVDSEIVVESRRLEKREEGYLSGSIQFEVGAETGPCMFVPVLRFLCP